MVCVSSVKHRSVPRDTDACHPLLLMLLFWETDVTSVLHSQPDRSMSFFATRKIGKKSTSIWKVKGLLLFFFAAWHLHFVWKYSCPIGKSDFLKPICRAKAFLCFLFSYHDVLFWIIHCTVGLPSCKFFRRGINRKKWILTEGSRKWLNSRCCTDSPMEQHFIQLRVIDYCVEICFSGHVL